MGIDVFVKADAEDHVKVVLEIDVEEEGPNVDQYFRALLEGYFWKGKRRKPYLVPRLLVV